MTVRRLLAAVVLVLLAAALAACLPAVAQAADPALSLTAAPAVLTAGSLTHVTSQGAQPGAGLTLSCKVAGDAGFVPLGTATADAGGVAVWGLKPMETTVYKVDQAAGPTWAAATAEVSVSVRPKLTLAVRAPRVLNQGESVQCTVTVSPVHPGATVQLARWDGAAWTPLKDATLGADSRVKVGVPAGAAGRLLLRAQMAADADHVDGHSPSWKRTVFDRSNLWGVPAKYAHLILVSVHHYKLYYFEHGAVVRAFDCVTGRPSLPTPLGHFRIYAKDPHIGGPYGPYRMRYLGLYAIHGTDEPWLLSRYPRNYSHGCTRLSNAHITWLYHQVSVGTRVWNVP